MKSLETKELVLKVTGEVQASNIKEFQKEALQHIANIKTELVTDQDFAEAKQVVKSCKVVEDRIANAVNQAVMSMETVAEIRTIAEKLRDKFRDTRLMLDKKVKSEEALRKSEITTGAVDEISKHLDASQVAHGFHVDIGAINDAIKNKRSLEKMKEAVAVEVDSQKQKIDDLEKLFLLNLTSIQNTEKEYPGLFPDAKRLALSPEEVVQAQIESRVNKFKFDPPTFTPAAEEPSFCRSEHSTEDTQHVLLHVSVERNLQLTVIEKIQTIFGVISIETVDK